ALLEPRLARLPAPFPEPVEIDTRLLGTIAGQKLDVLDRQKQLVAARIMDLQAIVRGPGGLDVGQAGEPADAVVDVDDEIARREARHFGDEIRRALAAAPRPHQAVAQNVLLADDRELGGLEARFEPEHRDADLSLR